MQYKYIISTRGKMESAIESFLNEHPDWMYIGFKEKDLYKNPGMKIMPYPSKWHWDERNKVELSFMFIENGDMIAP